MLKKISHIFLALLIAVTSMGLTISKHYCGSSFESVSINSTPESCCDGPCDLCHNETITIKLKDDFSLTTFEFDFTQIATLVPAEIQLLLIKVPEITTNLIHTPQTPPPLTVQRVLSNLQTFLL
ncbi:MAG: HYC_CC_PP family protein [Candidatus Aquicultor sp.]|jgi:hypothetical protein